jgi:hypothetical protein
LARELLRYARCTFEKYFAEEVAAREIIEDLEELVKKNKWGSYEESSC